jgi:hypothetical protein
MEQHTCQLPLLNKETGEVSRCKNKDVEVFKHEGSDFYFCLEHGLLFQKNIDDLYKALEKEVEDYFNQVNTES